MIFELKSSFAFNNDISSINKELQDSIKLFNRKIQQKDKTIQIKDTNIKKNILSFDIISEGIFRPHNALLQLKNEISKEFGKKHHIGIREIKITGYNISFELEKKPLKDITIPFADIKFIDKTATIILKDFDE